MDRDCKNCARNKPDVGCTSWDCDFIDRKEAIKAWKRMSNAKEVKYYDEDEKVERARGVDSAIWLIEGMADDIKLEDNTLWIKTDKKTRKQIGRVIITDGTHFCTILYGDIDIVRCKECVKHNTHRCHLAFDFVATNDDDFCSYGEREGE